MNQKPCFELTCVCRPKISQEQYEVVFTKPGLLGIKFISTKPPFIVKEVADLSLGVSVGHEMISIRSNQDSSWVSAREAEWPTVVDTLKLRPSYAVFIKPERFVISTPPPSPKACENSSFSRFPVTFENSGPLGVEFGKLEFPYRIRKCFGNAETLGVLADDCMEIVNGKSLENIPWEEVRKMISVRPVTVGFVRGILQPVNEEISRSLAFSGPNRLLTVYSKINEIVMNQISTISISCSIPPLPDELDKVEISELLKERSCLSVENSRLLSRLEEEEISKSDCRTNMEIENWKLMEKISEMNLEISNLKVQLAASKQCELEKEAVLENALKLKQDISMHITKNMEISRTYETCMQKLQECLDERTNLIEKKTVLNFIKGVLFRSPMNILEVIHKASELLGLTNKEIENLMETSSNEEIHGNSFSESFIDFLQTETD